MKTSKPLAAKPQRRLLIFVWLFGPLLLLSACGFQLRQTQDLPALIQRVEVISNTLSRELTSILEREIDLRSKPQSQTAVTRPGALKVMIILQEESLQRQLLSVFQNGQVAEYELIYELSYQVDLIKNGTVQASVTSQQQTRREYQDDPKQLLAKSKEFDLIVAETRQRASTRILDELPSQVLDLIMQSSQDVNDD